MHEESLIYNLECLQCLIGIATQLHSRYHGFKLRTVLL